MYQRYDGNRDMYVCTTDKKRRTFRREFFREELLQTRRTYHGITDSSLGSYFI
jgi:hypothetical protein